MGQVPHFNYHSDDFERENCCDDMAIAESKDKLKFIEALISFKEHSLKNSPYTLGFLNKRNMLIQRVSRIVYKRNNTLSSFEKVFCIINIVMLFFVVSINKESQTRSITTLQPVTSLLQSTTGYSTRQISNTQLKSNNTQTTEHNQLSNYAYAKNVGYTEKYSEEPSLSSEHMISLHELDKKNEMLIDDLEHIQQLRLQADIDRLQAEKDRQQADLDRIQAEKDREQADKDRHQAEKDRQQAEKDRLQAEKDRKQADIDRIRALNDRKAFDDARKNFNEKLTAL